MPAPRPTARRAAARRLARSRPRAPPPRRRRPRAGRSRPGCWSGASAAGAALAPGGTLGGSQAGARLALPARRRPGAERRAPICPLRRPRGAEAAAGLDWRPVAALPLHILAERRQALGRRRPLGLRASRSMAAPAAALPARLRLDAYAPGRHRRPRVARPVRRRRGRAFARRVGPVEVGAGAWGAAQPGAARLDAGPEPLLAAAGRAAPTCGSQADWRFRIAGDAAPGSGPALTLAADF